MTDLIERPDGDASLEAAEGISVEPITQWDLFINRLRRHRLAMASAWFLLFVVFMSFVVGPVFSCPEGDTFCGAYKASTPALVGAFETNRNSIGIRDNKAMTGIGGYLSELAYYPLAAAGTFYQFL